MNKRLWFNDGDYLVVRDDKSELSLSEAQAWATIIGLYGGSVILSDRMRTLSQSRLDILKKIFPIHETAATPVDFLKKEIPEILSADISTSNENWKIVALFNYSEFSTLKTLFFADIGLNTKVEYHVFGFWKQKYHGLFMNSISIPLEPHSCEIIAIRENKNVPQILGTDIHITCGGLEIESCEFANNTLNIKTADMARSGNIFIFVPDGLKPAEGLVKYSDNIWKTNIKFNGKTVKYILANTLVS